MVEGADATSADNAAAGRAALLRRLGPFAPVIFLIAMMIVFAILEPRFLSSINLFNVMRQISITGLVAIGMTFVILTAGIDLSVGSLLALAGLAAAIAAKGGIESRFNVGAQTEAAGYGWFAAMVVAMLVGTAGGWLQGFSITRLKVPPFVVTLGGLSAFRGLALLIAGGGPISGFDPSYVWWGQGRIGPVPVPVVVFLLFAAAAHVVLAYTRFGRQVYAVGGNPEAARLAGLPVQRTLVLVYTIANWFGITAIAFSQAFQTAQDRGSGQSIAKALDPGRELPCFPEFNLSALKSMVHTGSTSTRCRAFTLSIAPGLGQHTMTR